MTCLGGCIKEKEHDVPPSGGGSVLSSREKKSPTA